MVSRSGQLGPGAEFGPYRIDSLLGLGGMGVVYVATDQRLGRRVALKTMLGHLAKSPGFLERFHREAATLARLQSPHVIQIFDHGLHDGVPYIATQYAAGGDLGRLLRHRGPLPPALAAEICAQVADAMTDAHRAGVIHRDVKPANVLLRDDRHDRPHAYLCDFGIAITDAAPSGYTEPGAVTGTWSYLAPERIAGAPATVASDLYALGCLLWETLTGRPPYDGTDVEIALAHQDAPVPRLPGTDAFSHHANRILAGTLAKNPDQRYQTASVLRDDLRSLAGLPSNGLAPAASAPPATGAATTVARPHTTDPSQRPHRHRWKVAVLAGVAAVVAATALTVVLTQGGDGDGDEADPPPAAEPAPTQTSSAPVAAGRPTRGDLDGDGTGDLAYLGDATTTVFYSTGSAFKAPEKVRRFSGSTLTGDVDNDGVTDVIRLEGEPPRLAVSLAEPGAPVSPLTVPESMNRWIGDTQVGLADADGDGNRDLILATALAGQADDEYLKHQVDVALGDGTGVFGAVQTWYSGSLSTSASFYLDVDDDGRADLVNYNPIRGTAQVLRSEGSSFGPTSPPFSVVDQLEGASLEMAVADVDGDGTEELVSTGFGTPTIDVWSWNGTSFDQTAWLEQESDFGPLTEGIATADFDGNGFDDLAIVSTTTQGGEDLVTIATVYLNDGTAFSRAPGWSAPFDGVSLRGIMSQELN